MLLSLLLVETPPAAPVHPYLLYAVSLAGLLFGMYSFFRRESAEAQAKRELAAATRDERLAHLETTMQKHEQRFTGIVQQHERDAETAARKFETHENRLGEVPRLREEFASIRAKVDYMAEGFGKLEGKIDRLIERLTK